MDIETILAKVLQDENAFYKVPEELRRDKEVVLAVVCCRGTSLRYASENLKRDEEVVLAAVKQNPWAITIADETCRNNKKIVLAAVSQDGRILKHVSEKLKIDSDVFFTAIDNYKDSIIYVLPKLTKLIDRKIALGLMQQGIYIEFNNVSKELKNDKEVVLAAIQQKCKKYSILANVSERLKDDKDVVLAAVNQNGKLLVHVSKELKDDKDVVLAAVNQNGLALQYASKEFKNNRTIVLAAVKQNGLALEYASQNIKGDIKIVLSAICNRSIALHYATKELINNRNLILSIINSFTTDTTEQKKSLLLGLALELSSEKLRGDREVVLAAVRNCCWGLKFASNELQKDKKFLIKCYRKNNDICKYNDFIKEFNKLEKQEYDNVIIEKNIDILHLVKNKKQLCKYLLDNEQYNIIYQNEKIAEYIKDKYKIVILSLDEIKPIADDNIVVTEEEIKQKYSNNLFKINPKLTPIFIE
jgi:hypothetical protein